MSPSLLSGLGDEIMDRDRSQYSDTETFSIDHKKRQIEIREELTQYCNSTHFQKIVNDCHLVQIRDSIFLDSLAGHLFKNSHFKDLFQQAHKIEKDARRKSEFWDFFFYLFFTVIGAVITAAAAYVFGWFGKSS